MKILIDLTALDDNFSGIERYAACLAEQLIADDRHRFVLVFKNKVPSMFDYALTMKHVETLVIKGGNRLVFNQLTLPLALMKQRADCWLFMAFPVPVLLWKQRMISTIHDICCWDCPDSMKTLSKWYFRISQRIALWKCSRILTISEFSRRRIVDRLHTRPEKVELIYCAADKKFAASQPDAEQREKLRRKYALPEKFVLSLSTLEPRKNLRLLVQAYQQLVRENAIEEELVLAGRKGWKMDDLLAQTDEEVRRRIHFTGFVEDEDLPGIYAMTRLFVFPSMYEGFGLPPLEAMACGTPVLSSDAASMPEVLGEASGYFASGDCSALARSMQKMLAEDENERIRRGAAGRVRAAYFDWAAEARKLTLVMEQLVRKDGRRAGKND